MKKSLESAQDIVIGVACPKIVTEMQFEPIISKQGSLITLLGVGSLLRCSTLSIEESQCIVYYFPEGKTLTQTKEDPIKFHEWYESTVK